MGIGGVSEICDQLMANGLPASHPAAVIQHGTSRRQRVVIADLGTLSKAVAEANIKPPALIIIGTVVSMQKRLAWFKP
jgi:siroheme synthase